MLDDQKEEALSYIGTLPRDEIARKLGVSLANLKRSLDGVSFSQFKYATNPQLTKQVCDFYGKFGKEKTQKKFPDIKVRSIIEHYKHNPRQIRWKDSELIELAKMSCFISRKNQASIFDRPGAFEGSIHSAWNKRFKMATGNLHGWNISRARIFATKDCPSIRLPFAKTSTTKNERSIRKICLWVDIAKHLKKDCPPFVRKAVYVMSKFQTWLFDGDPRIEIATIMGAFQES